MQAWKLSVAAALLMAVAACRPPLPPAPTSDQAAQPQPAGATAAPATPAAAQPAAEGEELVKFSGAADAASNAFHLNADSPVEISWDYTGDGLFALWLVNDTEDLEDSSLYRVLIKESTGGSQESAQYTLSSGDYHLEVEMAGGPWTVQVKALQ